MVLTFYVEKNDDLTINCLELTAINRTRDMSVANESRVSGFYAFNEMEQIVGKDIALMEHCSPRIQSVTEKEVTVGWLSETYTLCPGNTVESKEYAIDNPYLSWDGISLKMEYSSINAWEEVLHLYDDIAKDQRTCPRRNNKAEKEKCLKLLNEIILHGESAVRPIYAWLQSCKNWDMLIIDDYALFAKHLKFNDTDEYSDYWFANLAQIFKRNRIDAVLDAVPSLKAVIETAANNGIEEAEKIRDGEIEYEYLTERHYPEKQEFVLTMRMYDKENDNVANCHFQWVTSELLKNGQKIDMGDFGEVTIVALEEDKVRLSWLGREHRIHNNYMEYLIDSRERPSPEEVENYDIDAWYAEMFEYEPQKYLLCQFEKMNIWNETLRVMNIILDPEDECQLEREQYVKVAKQLLKVLIDHGDKELEMLHDMITVDSNFDEIKELIDLMKKPI